MVHIVNREEWEARRPRRRDRQTSLVKHVFCTYTHTDSCTTIRSCRALIKDLQRTHMETLNYEDIGYNFLVGGDFNIYEGRGWKHCPELEDKYQDRVNLSLSIALCGRDQGRKAAGLMWSAREMLIKYGIKYNFIDKSYKRVYQKLPKTVDENPPS